GIRVRQGARPGALPRPRQDLTALHRDPRRAEAGLALQSVAALPPVPDGQARALRLHAVGQPDLQSVRLAAPLLPPAGGLRGELRGAAGDDALGPVRPAERQPEVPGLHGALRLRADRRERDLRELEGVAGHRRGYRDRAALIPDEERSLEGWEPQPGEELPLARIIDLAFDYRGNTTVVTVDGEELEGFVFNR